jgi:bifunctional DNA-binding transcriptional regulator/antitoxin component of YhaV-PrlF toxin-antitoxin module
MSESDTGQPDTQIVCNDLQVTQAGRVTIPNRTRERYGIDIGDTVDILVYTTSEDGAAHANMKVQNRGRLQIPHRTRESMDIDAGDFVSVVLDYGDE